MGSAALCLSLRTDHAHDAIMQRSKHMHIVRARTHMHVYVHDPLDAIDLLPPRCVEAV